MRSKYFDIFLGLLMICCSIDLFIRDDNYKAAICLCIALYYFIENGVLWEKGEQAKDKKSLITVAVTHKCLNGDRVTAFSSIEWNGEFTYEKYLEFKKRYYEHMMAQGLSLVHNEVAIISKIDFDEESMK